MRVLTRDDTAHDEYYVLYSEALKEIDAMQAQIDSLQVEVPRLRGMVDRMTLILKEKDEEANQLRRDADRMREIFWDKDTEIIRKNLKITRLSDLLRRGLSVLEYHTELTRPIAQTNEVIHEIYAALSEESKGTI
jgi:hypothetical protein